MATSGRINGTALNGGSSTGLYAFWADWTRNGEYNIVNNTSNITVYLRVQRVDGSSAGAYAYDVAPSVSLSVGGSARVPSISYIDTRNQVVCTFATWTGDVKHNPDGSPNCPIVASFTHYGSSTLGGGTLSGSADLDTIPQATSFDNLTCSTGYFTGTMTALYTPKASTLYNRFRMEFVHNGSLIHLQDVDFGTRPTTQQVATMVLDGDSLETIYNLLTTEPASGALRITLRTYSDAGYSNQVGNASFRMLTLSVPDSKDTKPAVTMSLSPVSSLPDAFNGLYIQGKTKVKASTFLATPQYGTSITSSGISVQGANYYAKDDYTSGYLTQYGSVTVTGFATDARGFTGNAPLDIDVIPYGKPKVLNVVAGRCDVDGNMSDSGTYLKINATRDYSPVAVGGVQKNFCAIQYRVRTSGGQYPDSWQTILDRTASGNTVASQPLMSGGLNKKTSYMVQIRVVDDIGESSDTEVSIPTEDVYMHRAKDAMGLGKYVEHDGLDMGWNIHMNGNRVTGLPAPSADTDAVPWGSVNGKFAPSGYGLGEEAPKDVEDIDTVTNTGFYRWYNRVDPLPYGWFYGTFIDYGNDDGLLKAKQYGGSIEVSRSKIGGVWQPWEWVNPPMVLGAEYRTTERFNGNPVFVKLVDCGALPNNSHKYVSYSDGYSYVPLEIMYGTTNHLNTIPWTWESDETSVQADAYQIIIVTTKDKSAQSARVAIKYAKSY